MTFDICPACEAGVLRPGPFLVRCPGCGRAMSREVFVTLRQIRGLPEVAGEGVRRLAARDARPPGPRPGA